MSDEKEVIIFYSWRSDPPKSTNLNAIRNALRGASSRVEAEMSGQNLTITLDEATKRVPGSPNIPLSIMEKIDASDIFVCDVTPIYKTSGKPAKSSPNPNVVFELGYAVAQLGWNRIILLFNKEFGLFPQELPFDFDRHRASPYTLSEASVPKKGPYKPLEDLLTEGIKSVISADPKRPSELRKLTPEQIQRQRDINNLRWLLENVHWPTLEQHVEEAPKVMHGRAIYLFEGFNGVCKSYLFHLFDQELLARVDAMHRAWNTTVSFGTRYEQVVGADHCVFTVPPKRAWTKQEEKAWQAIQKGVGDLHKAMKALLQYIRQNYLEIDIDELNSAALNRYVQEQESFRKSIFAGE